MDCYGRLQLPFFLQYHVTSHCAPLWPSLWPLYGPSMVPSMAPLWPPLWPLYGPPMTHSMAPLWTLYGLFMAPLWPLFTAEVPVQVRDSTPSMDPLL